MKCSVVDRHLSRQRHRCQHFQYFGEFIEIFWKHLFILHMVQMGPDPSRSGSAKLMPIRPDLDPHH
jgi:hypothetical protein